MLPDYVPRVFNPAFDGLLTNRFQGQDFSDFDSATLLLRLFFYVDQVRGFDRTSHNALIERCEKCLTLGLHEAAHGNKNAALQVLGMDPVNLVCAINCLSKEIRSAALGHYQMLLDQCMQQNVAPIHVQNQAIFEALLKVLPSRAISAPFGGAIQYERDFVDAAGLLQSILIDTCFGTQRGERSANQALLIRPLALQAIHENDLCAFAAVVIAAQLIGFSHLIEEDHFRWLSRMKRDDGLFGLWEAEGKSNVRALLQANMQIYCAFHCLHSNPCSYSAGLKPMQLQEPQELTLPKCYIPLDKGTLQSHSNQLCDWLDANRSQFDVDPQIQSKTELTKSIKPLVELALTFYLITEARTDHSDTPLHQWAKERACELYESIPWDGLIEYFSTNLSASLGLLLFPLVSKVAGQPMPFQERVENILLDPYSEAQERPPMRQMDFYFLARLCDIHSDENPSVLQQYQATLMAKQVHPLWYSTSSLYDLTHTIFYGTDFGKTEGILKSQPAREFIAKHIHDLGFEHVLRGDLDLAGEFLLNSLHTFQPNDGYLSIILHAFLNELPQEGPIQGPQLELHTDLNEFEACYHTTLVCLALIATLLFNDEFSHGEILSPPRHKEHPSFKRDGPNIVRVCKQQFGIDIIEHIQVSEHQMKTNYKVRTNQTTYLLSRYAHKPDWSIVRSKIGLYQTLYREGLSARYHPGINNFYNHDENCLWTLQAYLDATPLLETEWRNHYAIIGKFAATYHSVLRKSDFTGLVNHVVGWADRMHEEITGTLPERYLHAIFTADVGRAQTIHGDLNFANLMLSDNQKQLYVIDHDNSGLGLVEQELAIVLLYENRGQEAFLASRQSLISSYQNEGLSLSIPLLDAYTVTAPIYASMEAMRKKHQHPLNSLYAKQACLRQVHDRVDALGGEGRI